MTPIHLVRNLSWLGLAVGLAACGGSKPAAEAPAAPAAPAAPEASAAPAPSSAPAADAPAPSASADSASALSKPAVDILTAPKGAFVIDFGNSGMEDAIAKKCASDDPAKEAKCKTKKHEAFMADVLEFRSKNDQVTLIIYKRKGTRLTKLSSNSVTLTPKSDTTVGVEITGDDKKPRVIFPRTRKFDVVVPNDYSIEINEPTFGKLAYDAKIDIVGD